MYTLLVGLEHLQSGMEFSPVEGEPFTGVVFEMESPTTFRVWSLQPFRSVWHVADLGKLTQVAQKDPGYNPPTTPWTSNMVREQVEKNDVLRRSIEKPTLYVKPSPFSQTKGFYLSSMKTFNRALDGTPVYFSEHIPNLVPVFPTFYPTQKAAMEAARKNGYRVEVIE